MPKELNTKAYAITVKDNEALNQWLEEQHKVGLIGGIKLKICGTIFLHSKEGWISMISTGLQKIELAHDQGQNTITID